jgi:hypothetical protein
LEDEEAALQAVQRHQTDPDELRISTRIWTTTCRLGGFALAVVPPPAVAPLRKLLRRRASCMYISTHELCHRSHNHLSH